MKALKNILSMVIVIAMLAGCFTFTAFAADTVTISVEKAVPGYPVSVTVDGAAVTTETVTYYVADSEEGSYEPIDGASGDGWQITNACAKKYIKADVDGVKSNAIYVGAGASVNTSYWSPYGTVKDSPAQYKMKLADPSNLSVYYQLLDTETVDGKKQYLLLQQGRHATSGKVKKTNTDTKWDPEEELTLAYWLDKIWKTDNMQGDTYYRAKGGIFYDNANTMTQMDPALRSYLVDDKTWLTERDTIHILNDYTFKAGVTILSMAEYKKYYNKIGMSGIEKAWFRTPEKDAQSRQRLWYAKDNYDSSNGKLGLAAATTGTSSNFRAYPVFWITEDFFKNVKLDLAATGSDVRALILEHNNSDAAALEAIGYDDNELAELGVIPKVETEGISLTNASGEAIENGAITGTTSLTATYTIDNRTADTITGIKGIIAVFENGTLSTVTLGNIDAASGEGTYPVTLTGLDASKTYTARVMAWKDLGTLIPLGTAAEFSND